MGNKLNSMQMVYQGLVLPILLYGCSIWYDMDDSYRKKTKKKKILSKLGAIHSTATRIITRAFRTTPNGGLEVELCLLLMHLRLQKALSESALRMRASTGYERLRDIRAEGNRDARKRRENLDKLVSLMELLEAYLIRTLDPMFNNLERISLHLTLLWWNTP